MSLATIGSNLRFKWCTSFANSRSPDESSASFQLLPHCKLVTGKTRAAIYDLERGNVYSLNETAREILQGVGDSFEFWQRLQGMGLAEMSG